MSIAEIVEGSEIRETSVSGLGGSSWARQLDEWSSLPARSHVWDEVEEFIEALRGVAEAKVTERNASKEALRASLETLHRDFSGDLEYFEAQTSTWQADPIAWNEADRVDAQVARLREQLEQRRAAMGRQGRNYSETRKLREEINAIEDLVSDEIAELSETFATANVQSAVAPTNHSTRPRRQNASAAKLAAPVEPPIALNAPELQAPADEAVPQTEESIPLEAADPILTSPVEAQPATGETDFGAESVPVDGFAEEAALTADSFPDQIPAAPVEEFLRASDSEGFVLADPGQISEPEAEVETLKEFTEIEADGLAPTSPTGAAASAVTPSQRPNGTLRRQIDPTHGRYSPLTNQQERTILTSGPGVGLILASSVMGFEQLPDAASSLVSTVFDERAAYATIPSSISDGQEIFDWLTTFANRSPDVERLMACQPVVMPAADIASRVEGALRFCEERGEPSTRVLFLFAPGASWAWLNLPEERWEIIADRIHPRFALRPWSEEALRDRLDRQGVSTDPQAAALALEATGGWTWCVDQLFELCEQGLDLNAAIEKLRAGLVRGGELHDELLMRMGVRADTLPDTVLKMVLQQGEMATEEITPERVGGNATHDECRAAVELLQAMSCLEGDERVVRVSPFLARLIS